jgi:hypothetical protein
VLAGVAWSGIERLERAVIGEQCGPLPAAEPSIADLGRLREKVSAYRADPSEPLVLEPSELSWALTEQYHTPVWLLATGEGVDLIRPMALADGVCADLEYRGRLAIRHGKLVAHPEWVRFAGWTLPVPPGMKITLDAEDFGADDPALLGVLAVADRVRVADGRFEIELSDPSVLP